MKNFQGKGYGSKIFDFAESLANITQIDCVSCRTDLFPFYVKRGYVGKASQNPKVGNYRHLITSN